MPYGNKMSLRQTVLVKRDALTKEELRALSELIKERLFSLDEFQAAGTTLFYASFRSEVYTHQMIREALELGKEVVLPRVDLKQNQLELFKIRGFEDGLTRGAMGILEPSPEKSTSVLPAKIDLAVVPGVAFDLRGYRLGYGGGYFDRLLPRFERQTMTVGLAFEVQLVGSLPVSSHDVPVKKIITEKRIIDCYR